MIDLPTLARILNKLVNTLNQQVDNIALQDCQEHCRSRPPYMSQETHRSKSENRGQDIRGNHTQVS